MSAWISQKLNDRIRLGVFVALACDADYQRLSHRCAESARLTIKQALEVLEETK